MAQGRVAVSDMDARALSDDIIDALLTDLDDATMRAQDRSIEAFRMAVAANCVFCAVSGCRWRFAGIPSAGPLVRWSAVSEEFCETPWSKRTSVGK